MARMECEEQCFPKRDSITENTTANANTDAQVPIVSVIIPAYNAAAFICEALDSVLAQTFKAYEIIVINDGSPDSEELENNLTPYLDNIIYLKHKNLGAGAARNSGLRRAQGTYVAFLDGDDAWLPDYLVEQLRLIESDGGYDLVYANALLVGRSPWEGKTYMDRDPSNGPVTFEALIGEHCLVITSGVLARRKPIMEIGLFDESLRNSQDFDLWVRLAKRGHARMNYQRKVLLRHRATSGSLASDGIKSVEGELKVLQKVREWDDLTPSERATLEKTTALRSASVSVDRGKRALLQSDFSGATESFCYAYDYYRSPRLKFVLWLLRIAPRSLRRAYQCRIAGQTLRQDTCF